MDHTSRQARRCSAPCEAFPLRCHPEHRKDPKGPDAGRVPRQVPAYPARCRPERLRPPLDDRQRGLATHYLPLARSLARRMTTYHPEWRDEFQSAAFLALVEAAQLYEPERNVDFSTYARHRIWGAVRDTRRQLMRNGSPGSESAPRTVIRMSDVLERHGRVVTAEPDEPVGTELETHETVAAWINRLPRAQAQALRLIYIDGRTQEQAAEAVGCSKASISRLHHEGLSWLRHGYATGRRWQSAAGANVEACA
ncbi:MAG: sigma-70 family RNA polymerase sigma factor [Isosphaeraceae bacterium]